jgi:hypothetical protein
LAGRSGAAPDKLSFGDSAAQAGASGYGLVFPVNPETPISALDKEVEEEFIAHPF